MEKNLNITPLLDEYGPLLPERQLKCLQCYYEEDLSLSEIAENEGITRQGVRDNIKRGELFLGQCEEKLGLIGRFDAIGQHIDNLSEAIEKGDLDRAQNEITTVRELL